ncbi:MAG: dephospho-CoA kinase [Endozoicomonas sp. (ex Botrylloides leachii)]|nr:dephospho-CoA kinase [Endozoicomonas sp. (ex Botrylloides leachii)]
MHHQREAPFIVGITGGIGSGKSAATDFLSQQGIIIVDADVAARIVVEPGQPALDEITERYGSDMLLTSGSLNRKKLRDIIFNNKNEKQWLEQRLHPRINQLLWQQLASAHSPYVVLVSPLLIETAQYKKVDRVLVVDVSETVQLERSMIRDGMTKGQAEHIIKSQTSREKRLSYADDVIDNNGTLTYLYSALSILHARYLCLAKNTTST